MSDGAQSMTPEQLTALVEKLRKIAAVVDRKVTPALEAVPA
jgi:3-deoxy-D-arabino-heptulosonate 7-phosphate (DAHP) synthase